MHGDLYSYSLRWYLVCKSLHFIVSHSQIVNNFVVSHSPRRKVSFSHDIALQSNRKVTHPGLILNPSTSWQAGNIYPDGICVVLHKHTLQPATDRVQHTRNLKQVLTGRFCCASQSVQLLPEHQLQVQTCWFCFPCHQMLGVLYFYFSFRLHIYKRSGNMSPWRDQP